VPRWRRGRYLVGVVATTLLSCTAWGTAAGAQVRGPGDSTPPSTAAAGRGAVTTPSEGAEPPGTGRVAEADEIVPLATTTRAFGRQPYVDTVAAAATSAASSRTAGCGLSDAKLAAIMLSITFTEAGPLDSATVAPSPMTLSRWDGSAILYAFGDPATTFRNAFWHPGIGLWQFDHPWPNTAAERIDTAPAARLAAQVVSDRFCRWTAATGLSRFAYSVAPWHGCDDPRGDGERCREIFLNNYRDNDPTRLDDDTLVNFTLVDNVSALGGASRRTCQLVGTTATVPCLFVDPAAAEGSRAWTSPTFSPNPLSAPFYVLRDGDAERRFWLRDDTGYGMDIDASATIGSDPRSTLRWSSGPRLCDRTARKGACDLRPPSWKDWTVLQVSGTYQPFTGDFDGDGRADIFWYGAGSAPDSVWFGEPGGNFSPLATPVSGTYQPFTGDFDGDGRADIFWYGAGSAPDSVWFGEAGRGFTQTARAVDGTYEPLVGDFDGDGRADVFWYAPGSPAGSPDRMWRWTASRSVIVSDMPVSGSYEPLVGDFDGDGRADLFLYGAGSYPDHVWYGTASATFEKRSRPVSGVYRPLVGDFDGDTVDDVFWYAPGSPSDSVWYGTAARGFQAVARPVAGNYQPVVGDISGNGTTDIVWYAAGVAADSVWRGTPARTFVSDSVVIDGTYVPLLADMDGSPGDDVFWYRAGSSYDALWFD
jgi:FG-GAP-like repeat